MVWQELDASIYMCWPVRVPQTRGGFGPDGLDIVRLSSEHCPFFSCGGGGPGHHKLLKVNSYLADICGGRTHSVGAGGGGCGGGPGHHKFLKVNSYLADICGGRTHSVGAGGGGCGGGLGEVGVVGAGGASTPNTQDTAHSKSISTSTASSSTDSRAFIR